MKSLNTSIQGRGFTLIETLIVLGLIGMIAVVGIIVGLDTYSRYIFRSDLDKTVSLLQKARSSAINNMYESKHGVYLGDIDSLILFRGTSYDSSSPYNYNVEKSKASYADTCSSVVVFDQLTGNTTNCVITITEGTKVSTITINDQGGINY